MKISDSELEVLRVLWAASDWVGVGEVCKALEAHGWKYKTVGTFLLRLQEKGMVEARKEGKVNQYRPRFSEAEYKHQETAQFLHKSLLAALYQGEASEDLLDELERRLREG